MVFFCIINFSIQARLSIFVAIWFSWQNSYPHKYVSRLWTNITQGIWYVNDIWLLFYYCNCSCCCCTCCCRLQVIVSFHYRQSFGHGESLHFLFSKLQRHSVNVENQFISVRLSCLTLFCFRWTIEQQLSRTPRAFDCAIFCSRPPLRVCHAWWRPDAPCSELCGLYS